MRVKWEATKKWYLAFGLVVISATFMVSSRLRRLSPAHQATDTSPEVVAACFDHSHKQNPIHKTISVFQLKTSWHTLPAGQSAPTNTVREQIRAQTGELLA